MECTTAATLVNCCWIGTKPKRRLAGHECLMKVKVSYTYEEFMGVSPGFIFSILLPDQMFGIQHFADGSSYLIGLFQALKEAQKVFQNPCCISLSSSVGV